MNDDLESKIQAALQNPQNVGEMEGADAIGTVGSENCGDMLRMWVKFKEENGRKVIDKATFQTFGCQTAIAVASVATELIRGKTAGEALAMSGEELASPLGSLPPMKIHCAQLVEGALKNALTGESAPAAAPMAPTLMDQFAGPVQKKVVLKK
jgi:NifU-like protein involved in Fe-S cluster formation